jgi:hypothetical protein
MGHTGLINLRRPATSAGVPAASGASGGGEAALGFAGETLRLCNDVCDFLTLFQSAASVNSFNMMYFGDETLQIRERRID